MFSSLLAMWMLVVLALLAISSCTQAVVRELLVPVVQSVSRLAVRKRLGPLVGLLASAQVVEATAAASCRSWPGLPLLARVGASLWYRGLVWPVQAVRWQLRRLRVAPAAWALESWT